MFMIDMPDMRYSSKLKIYLENHKHIILQKLDLSILTISIDTFLVCVFKKKFSRCFFGSCAANSLQ